MLSWNVYSNIWLVVRCLGAAIGLVWNSQDPITGCTDGDEQNSQDSTLPCTGQQVIGLEFYQIYYLGTSDCKVFTQLVPGLLEITKIPTTLVPGQWNRSKFTRFYCCADSDLQFADSTTPCGHEVELVGSRRSIAALCRTLIWSHQIPIAWTLFKITKIPTTAGGMEANSKRH
jgi:hypothetical protein